MAIKSNLKQLDNQLKKLESTKVNKDAAKHPTWTPFPGPQTTLIESDADEVFFGGAAGGGKSASIVGMALTHHYRSLILRRDASQLTDIIDQLKQFAPPGSHWRGIGNGGKMTTPEGRVIELAGMPHEDDKRKYQGRPHDLNAFDEVTELSESQVEFVSSWNRSTRKGQHCLKLLTGNPPTHSGGGWILRRYAHWIDPSHGKQAKPGQKLWFARIDGSDDEEEFPDATPITFKGMTITPQSRTFIPAKLADNPRLRDTNYASKLAHMPAALRDALLFGDFSASLQDDPWAVIPTSWIRAALQRWESHGGDNVPLTRAGLDIAYGGSDSTVLALRYGNWIAPFHSWRGEETDSGKKAARHVLPILKGSKSPVNVDVIGYGAAAYEFLKENNVTTHGVNFGAGANGATDRRGILQFANMRALCYWNLRDMLDPELGDNLALPPDDDLLAELAAPKYEWRGGKIFIAPKADISAELGRSPDKADAVALACHQPAVTPFFVESW
jgi:hypothetical protein